MIALALGSGVLFVDYVFFLAPGAEKRKPYKLRFRQNFGLCLLAAFWATDKTLFIDLQFPASLVYRLMPGFHRRGFRGQWYQHIRRGPSSKKER